MEAKMPRFEFSVSTDDTVRQAGVVHSHTFTDAISLVNQHVTASQGDTLEIGVRGFPPARFECVNNVLEGEPLWMPPTRLAQCRAAWFAGRRRPPGNDPRRASCILSCRPARDLQRSVTFCSG